MALALVLLVGAALLIRTFASLHAVRGGFEPHNLITLQTSLAGDKYASTAQLELLSRRMVERLEGLPGVEAASSSISIPIEGGPDLPFTIEGRPASGDSLYHGEAQWREADADYFKALKVPLLRGRVFTLQDSANAPAVVVINETMAKKYWPKQDPMGQRITIGKGLGPQFDDPTRQVVGIVGDVRENGLDNPAPEVYYVPLGQAPEGLTQLVNAVLPRSWLIRTSVDPRSLVQAFKKEFLAMDNQLAIARVRTMEQVIVEATARQGFNMLLLTIFACVALLLASIGIYGVMSYAVEQRTHEIGIRMALGARTGDMMRLVVGNGMKLVAIGVVVGLAGSFWLTRYMSALLYGVKPTDPSTYVAVASVLLAVAFLATYIPARRAAQVDPVIALRYE
jgi:predicted permease